MKKQILFLLGAVLCCQLTAETYWKEDGSNLKTSEKYSQKVWYGKGIRCEAVPGQGFLLSSGAAHFLPELKGPAWLVAEVTSAEIINDGKYSGWTVSTGKTTLMGNVRPAKKGLYTVRFPQGAKPLLIFRIYNQKILFREIALVDKPENSVELLLPAGNTLKQGDKLKVLLTLKEPCEDVSCQLFYDAGRGLTAFDLNGSNSVNLKPEDEECRIWSAEIVFQQSKTPKAGNLIVKAVVLGGKIRIPLYSRSALKL